MWVLWMVSWALLSICFVVWNLDPFFQLVLGNRGPYWGQEASPNQIIFKATIKLCCWFGNKPGVKSFWSHVELNEGPQTKSSTMKKNGILWKPGLVSLCRELTVLFWVLGINRVTGSKWPHTSPTHSWGIRRGSALEWSMGRSPG